MTISTLLLVAAFILFILATIPVPSRINLVALGLALWTLNEMLAGHLLLH